MVQKIPYWRFVWMGMVFAILLAVLVVSPNILLRDADPAAAVNEYALSVVILFMVWCLNLLGLRLFESRTDQRTASRQRIVLSFLIVIGLMLLLFANFEIAKPPPPPRGADSGPVPLPQPFDPNWVKSISGFITGFSANLLVLLALEVLLLRNTKTRMEADNMRLREEKLQAVNMMLKQQIQPHFLFNSLNTLKSLIHKNTDHAEEYLLKLSDFLRRSISSGENVTVPIYEELTLCSNYLDLQSLRFGTALNHEFNISQSTIENGQVPPFSIQLLLENAIKHNVLTEDSPLTISVEEDNGWISVRNNLQHRSTNEESTGIGLANLRARYASVANEEIIIDSSENQFTVKIKIL